MASQQKTFGKFTTGGVMINKLDSLMIESDFYSYRALDASSLVPQLINGLVNNYNKTRSSHINFTVGGAYDKFPDFFLVWTLLLIVHT